MNGSLTGVAHSLSSARLERERAERAALIAQRHEGLSWSQEAALGDLHRRLAGIHRRIARRHLAAAEIHEAYAERLAGMQTEVDTRAELSAVSAAFTAAVSAAFMAAVALTARSQRAVVTLRGTDHVEAMVAVSDPIAAQAQDLEFTLGEGPNHDVLATGRAVYSTGSGLAASWPSYGGAAADLGVTTVAAVPLEGPGDKCLGSLAVLDPWLGERGLVLPVLHTVAEALTQSVLLTWDPADAEAVPPFFAEADYRHEIFQAAGLVMVQCRCDFDSALALLRARAYATSTPIAEISTDVVDGRLRLDSA
jgi:hypothetical protein